MKKIFMILALMSCVVWGCQAQRKKPILKTTKDSTIVDKSMIKDAKMTKYFYTTADKTKYPIYMSSDGKCFIIRTSIRKGKQYRQYLPQMTKRLAAE